MKRGTNDPQKLHRKQKIEQHELFLKSGVNSCASEGKLAPAPSLSPVVLLLAQTRRQVMNAERSGL